MAALATTLMSHQPKELNRGQTKQTGPKRGLMAKPTHGPKAPLLAPHFVQRTCFTETIHIIHIHPSTCRTQGPIVFSVNGASAQSRACPPPEAIPAQPRPWQALVYFCAWGPACPGPSPVGTLSPSMSSRLISSGSGWPPSHQGHSLIH